MYAPRRWLAASALLALALGWGAARPAPAAAPVAASAPAAIATFPLRAAYFGDLHLHTALSFDAYTLMGARVMPEDSYRFARGEAIAYLGQPVRRRVPLDFLAITDHAENLGVFNQLDDPASPLSQTEIGKMLKAGGHDAFMSAMKLIGKGADIGANAKDVSRDAWAREIAAANAAYRPGQFTSFIAYEWTVNPDNQNLHRNVIFRGGAAPAPFTRFDSDKPEALWSWLAQIRSAGQDALAIPHNGNVSNGLMFDWVKSDGTPIDAATARARAANEPLTEIAQNKGTSETHPALSPNDEFAGFEQYQWLLAGEAKRSSPPGSFWRDALGRGMVIRQRTGVNPFKYGAAGASDLHSGLSVSSEEDYGGVGRANLGGGKMGRAQIEKILADAPKAATRSTDIITSSGALTGVWAESNTRDAIFAALRRKETFATSGTRIRVRFFAGPGFGAAMLARPDWVKSGYGKGVPMGGDLPVLRQSPGFAIEALKDPDGANLDRVQLIKVWLAKDGPHEQIFTVLRAGPKGAPQLKTLWRDPGFDPRQQAAWYVRVLELPTPRWSTLRAREFGLPLPANTPALIQERAWTSPIWYDPAAQAASGRRAS